MEIAVIGGGLSGLATSAFLAKKGHQVTLLEKNATLGGRARALKDKGFLFDMGPSWYMMPEVIESIFQALGTSTKKFFTLQELKNKYRVFVDDVAPVDFVSDLQQNLAIFEKLAPGSSLKIRQLLRKTDQVYDLAVNHFLDQPYLKISDFFNFSLLVNFLKICSIFNPLQNYHRLVKKYVSDPFLQKIFEFQTVFLGGEPFSTPALYSILISADFREKIWYPMGGMIKLVEALEQICLQHGVKIIKEATVQKITSTLQTKKVDGIDYLYQKQKLHLAADIVVSSADYPFTELNLLTSDQQQYPAKYWQQKDFSIACVLVYLGISKKLTRLRHHNFYFQKNWNQHFTTIQKSSHWPEEPNFYLSAPSITDPSIAPANQENLFLLVPVSIKTTTQDLEAYVARTLVHVENKIGEKFIQNIIYQKIYAQNDFAKDYFAYGGNALGLSHRLSQSVFLRPNMKSKHLRGLYYTGQFTQPGVGVPMVLLSAKYVADLITNESST